ncbi:TPA: hypothetical protein MC633_000025 [Raoultella planticola]|nr:hypothetical protein [Raoultella planticola]
MKLSLSGVKVGAISQNRFIVRQNVALGLLIQHVNISVSEIDNFRPQAPCINDHRGG